MKVTFPHLGPMWIPLKAFFDDLNCEVVVPPPTSKKTLEIGSRYSPEFACLPLKITVGNMVEALDTGADTIVMAGGVGPCRFGFYCELEKEILKDLGYEFTMVVLDPPQGKIGHIVQKIRYLTGGAKLRRVARALLLAWMKIKAIDSMETAARVFRANECEKGTVSRKLDEAYRKLDFASGTASIRSVTTDFIESLKESCIIDDYGTTGSDRVKIGIVGEIYVVLEPYANHDVEKILGEMGVLVDRSITMSHWFTANVILDVFRLAGGFNPGKMALPYLKHTVGGHGRETIAHAVQYANRGFDGVIQVAPFTCMPEIVAESILSSVAREKKIAAMTVVVDEQTGDAGLVTRLEAFVDMLARQKQGKHRSAGQLFDSDKPFVLS